MKEAGVNHLRSVRRKYLLLGATEVILWAMAVILLTFFSTKPLLNSNVMAAIVAAGLGGIVAYFKSSRLHLFTLNEIQLAHYLNHKYPSLQESVDLLLKDENDLSPLQQLQRDEVLRRFNQIYPTIKLPHQTGRASIALLTSIALSILLTSFLRPLGSSIQRTSPGKALPGVNKQFLPPSVASSVIRVTPPAYTQIEPYTASDFNTTLPEGSNVEWTLTFEGLVSKPAIIFSGSDTIAFMSKDNRFTVRRTFTESGFYQFCWQNQDGISDFSDFYRLDIQKDNAPDVQILKPAQTLELSLTDSKTIDLMASITDDYALTNSSIIATVSKGTGEAVKFREERLRFDKPGQISGKKIEASKTLDLTAMGLEPGDELYFYIEASDNKVPGPNRARTETYFITLQDTSSRTNSVEASLGVDLMPEYFRSQRQIIIDSEKLLRQKKLISKQNFNERSNELGYDQKVLRLRYGEFLGEEFESGIGPREPQNEDAGDEDVRRKFGHDHDRENEHNLVDDGKEKDAHDHNSETIPGEKKNPLEGFVHSHDNDEEATFFVQSIKAKLKAAVTVMWDAELYLRLYQPEKSLPYQYKALKLLKEISQDSRIYVHRTGFDPPPVKEDKRLTGDLTGITSSTSKVQSAGKERLYPSIKNAIATIDLLIHEDSITISKETKETLSNAGREIATMELKKPGHYLKTLSWLNDLIHDKTTIDDRKVLLMRIRSALWSSLPKENRTPAAESGTIHELDREFLKTLNP